jgi:hypothetical protein
VFLNSDDQISIAREKQGLVPSNNETGKRGHFEKAQKVFKNAERELSNCVVEFL